MTSFLQRSGLPRTLDMTTRPARRAVCLTICKSNFAIAVRLMRQLPGNLGTDLPDEAITHRYRDLLRRTCSGNAKHLEQTAERAADTSAVLASIDCCILEFINSGSKFRLLIGAEAKCRRNLDEEARELPDLVNVNDVTIELCDVCAGY